VLEGRRQLIVYRAFFEPGVFGWPDHGCRGCSLGAAAHDTIDLGLGGFRRLPGALELDVADRV
jgi:predicted dithiol-disulfide oxidoreductase (DUF899 family)